MPSITENVKHAPGMSLRTQEELLELLQATQVDLVMLKLAFDTLVTKLNADAVAQNLAVASSQLDEDYAGSGVLTLTQ